MSKFTKFLAIPLALTIIAGCENDTNNTEEDTTEDVAVNSEEDNSTTVESESAENEESEDSEDTDADTEATGDMEGPWSDSEIDPAQAAEEEDLHAGGESEFGTTIDADMESDEWVEEAAETVNAVEGDTYVKLDRGVLTVDQLNAFFKAMPRELTYADDNNQFIFYNHMLEPEDMLGSRRPDQVGNSLADVHPEYSYENVSWVINSIRNGERDHVRMAVPSPEGKFVVHDYYGMYDEDGNYMGINEIIHDILPLIEFYAEQTGQDIELIDGSVDAASGATSAE